MTSAFKNQVQQSSIDNQSGFTVWKFPRKSTSPTFAVRGFFGFKSLKFDSPDGTKYAFRYFPGERQPADAKGPGSGASPCDIWICNSDLSGHFKAFRSPVVISGEGISRLANTLGDEHDLSVFRETVYKMEPVDGETFHALLSLIDCRCDELRNEIRPLGECVFAEKTKHLARRFRAYWDASHE